jgi:hypothetical protein
MHYANQLIDLLLVLVAAWMVPAGIFFIYAYFAGHPVGESVVGRLLVISFFLITASIWLPIKQGKISADRPSAALHVYSLVAPRFGCPTEAGVLCVRLRARHRAARLFGYAGPNNSVCDGVLVEILKHLLSSELAAFL